VIDFLIAMESEICNVLTYFFLIVE